MTLKHSRPLPFTVFKKIFYMHILPLNAFFTRHFWVKIIILTNIKKWKFLLKFQIFVNGQNFYQTFYLKNDNLGKKDFLKK